MSAARKPPPPPRSSGRAAPRGRGTLSHLVPAATPGAGAVARTTRGAASPAAAPMVLTRQGQQRMAAGDLAAAERLFRQALAEQAGLAPALAGLGLVAARTGHMAAAADLFGRAAEADPSVPEHAMNGASALWALGRREEAVACLTEAVTRAPRHAGARVALGRARLELGDAPAAEADARTVLKSEARHPGALALLGRALLKARRPDSARPELEKAVRAAPDDPSVRNDLALAQAALGDRPAAIATLRAALAHAEAAGHKAPPDPAINLAGYLIAEQRADEAESLLEPLCAQAPDHAGVWLALGDARQRQGHFDAAREAYRAALERDGGNVAALRGLVKCGRVEADDPALAALRKMAARADLPAPVRAEALFALGKALEDIAAPSDDVFAALSEANALQAEQRPDDIPARQALAERARGVYTPALIKAVSARMDPATPARSSRRPVFIVGLPRSGTSLVEQMIASHPDVAGAGELGIVPAVEATLAAASVRPEAWPEGLETLAPERLATAAGRILTALDQAARRAGRPDAVRVSDKLPDNAMRLGLIATLLPGARVIVCRRDPMDTGLSLFQQNFAEGVPFSNSLDRIGRAIVLHDRLMAHWGGVLTLDMLTVDYEDLVEDIEGQGRRLIGFLDLPWDDSVARFHETERFVYTASKWQVRQPAYTASVGRWRRHANSLEPLRAMLDAAGLLNRPV